MPVVLASSKTLVELQALRRRLELAHPVICENGAFIDVPQGYFSAAMPVREPPPAREQLQVVYREVKAAGQFRCRAFFELGVTGIVAATGLDAAAAARANERQATEPVLWEDSPQAYERFCAAVEAQGLRCLRGGRFVHVMGDADKASAMLDLLDAYRQVPPPPTSIALGDGPNDVAMLAAADIAVIVRGHHAHRIELEDHPYVLRTQEYGPLGWHNAIRQLLNIQ